MGTILVIIIAILAGTVMPIQAGVNSSLSKFLGHSFHAAVISFFGGFLAMLLASLFTGQILPQWSSLSKIHPIYFTGGLLGCVMVVTSIILAPRLGATVLISCLLTGQLVASLILDHYGWIGFNAHPINPMRILGVLLLFLGVVLVRIY